MCISCAYFQGDATHDSWLFCLATLLGSTLVYNMFGVIDEGAVHKLKYLLPVGFVIAVIVMFRSLKKR